MQKGNVSGFENCCDGGMINRIGTLKYCEARAMSLAFDGQSRPPRYPCYQWRRVVLTRCQRLCRPALAMLDLYAAASSFELLHRIKGLVS